jgi:translation initiation factor IF-1
MPKKSSNSQPNTELIKKGDEAYARAHLPAGNGQYRVYITETGQEVIAKIRGSLKTGKNNKISPGRLVLLQPDYSSTQQKWFIIYVYSEDNIKFLRKSGEVVDVKEKEVSNVVFVDDSAPITASNDESDGDDEDFVNGI